GVERPEPVTAALLAHLTDSTAQPHDDATARPQNDTPHEDAPHTHTPHNTTHHTDTTPHTDPSRHAAGMAVRRDVLGNAHVDRAVARTTPFTARFQDFITRYAWGEIWTGDGLDRRTRSCITLTALIAHGHDAELAMHIRAALTNGLTREEIGEVLLQSAIYCGVPAANSAFATAQRVFDEIDAEHVTTRATTRASTTTATTTTTTTTAPTTSTKVDTASRSDTEK
ncbi:3-oxoadipate enol-lactonase / 4-carboxymuconolactone decarboxylase, partial [Streptomyces sp. MnatMP-M27]|uniref:4-carboxymuconolactone decarboxylase n=1 Tax=Streptomyces sp. MnatMP-M27 TaxID=1839768 RepID=UPI00081DA7FB